MAFLTIYIFLSCVICVYCSICETFPLVTDFGPENCTNENFFYNENAHGCFPGCVQKTNDFTNCVDHPCPPGYQCNNSTNECEIDKSSCFKYHVSMKNLENRWLNASLKPTCLTDGSWAPKQCKGEAANGRCLCYDARGNRIFGEAFWNEADDMTCACSRQRAELEESGDMMFVSLHCDSMGNYEPLQCNVTSEQCWCADTKTGRSTSTIVPLTLFDRLPCYNSTLVGSQYLRQCESIIYAQRRIANEFNAHGTTTLNFNRVFCQYDGGYGPIDILGQIASCVWRDNSILGDWRVELHRTVEDMACNCARNTRIFSNAGLRHPLACLSNGDYNPVQLSGRFYFCVDHDGFMISQLYKNMPNCTQYLSF